MSLYERRALRGDPLVPAYARTNARGRTWIITTSIGGFRDVPIAWDAADEDDAVASFIEFLEDDYAVGQLDRRAVPRAGWRRIDVRIQGQAKRVVFQSRWVASFSIERGTA